jgi:hypothetical protein
MGQGATLRADTLAAEVSAFVAEHTPARRRWEYALSRATYGYQSPRTGHVIRCINERTIPVIGRFLGVPVTRTRLRLQSLVRHHGFDQALDWYAQSISSIAEPFAVGAT